MIRVLRRFPMLAMVVLAIVWLSVLAGSWNQYDIENGVHTTNPFNTGECPAYGKRVGPICIPD